MKPKKILLVFTTTILTLIWCSAVWADRSNLRDQQQTQRIAKGIRSGEISRPEARRLKNEQRHVNRANHRALADGHVNWREHQRLDKMQDRASRHIYRAKHNNVRRRHAVVHRHNVNCYYPVAVSVDADGYEFSVGLSDIGWQFAFSGWSR